MATREEIEREQERMTRLARKADAIGGSVMLAEYVEALEARLAALESRLGTEIDRLDARIDDTKDQAERTGDRLDYRVRQIEHDH